MGAGLCRLSVADVVVPKPLSVRSVTEKFEEVAVNLTETFDEVATVVEKVTETVEEVTVEVTKEVTEKVEEVVEVTKEVAEKVATVTEKVEEITEAQIKSASETLSDFFASLTPPKESVAMTNAMENFIIEVTQDVIKKEEAKHSGPLSPEMIEKLEALSRTVLMKVLPLPPSP